MTQQIYIFGSGSAEGNATMTELLGGKGANLAEMSSLSLPVPYGLTITTEVCNHYLGGKIDMACFYEDLVKPELDAIRAKFDHPIIFSVRSGARVSMPGMMDTILNVGIPSAGWDALNEHLGFDVAQDCYTRGREMFKGIVGSEMPADPDDQFIACIAAVFESWNSDRAMHYRKMNGYPETWGTAVTIQMMVFGNASDQSATGVLFTRDPATGENRVTGEYLINAQGEDVVAGTATPMPLDEAEGQGWHTELMNICQTLEYEYHDMMDIEFTVENGKLWILQCRKGKRSAKAAFQIAADMLEEKLITKSEVRERLSGQQYEALTVSKVDEKHSPAPVTSGIAGGGSAVQGVAVLSSEAAVASKVPCILVTAETTPNDIKGMEAAEGILTQTGGLTCHAAVVARGMDRTCVVGCKDLFTVGIIEGVTLVTIDGATGNVWIGDEVVIEEGARTKVADKLMQMVSDKGSKCTVENFRLISWTYRFVRGTLPKKLRANWYQVLDCTRFPFEDQMDDAEFESMIGLTKVPTWADMLQGIVDMKAQTPKAKLIVRVEPNRVDKAQAILQDAAQVISSEITERTWDYYPNTNILPKAQAAYKLFEA